MFLCEHLSLWYIAACTLCLKIRRESWVINFVMKDPVVLLNKT